MIVRIVKMTFATESVPEFLSLFEEFKAKIRDFDGCTYLQVLQDEEHPNIIFSYSYWQQASDLSNYRNSELFKSVWSRTKQLFSAKPEAWTTVIVHDLK